MTGPAPYAPVLWLAKPVPLWPGHCRVMVCGVSSDAPKGLKRYWLQLGKPPTPEERRSE
jgi:hypothetical protein